LNKLWMSLILSVVVSFSSGMVAESGELSQTEFLNGDARADAPELAYRGDYGVGVRTVNISHPNQLDMKNYHKLPNRYDRPLTLEVWYPATIPAGAVQLTRYSDVLGQGPDNPERPLIPFTFPGRALRDAQAQAGETFPLIIVSHGYAGSRVLFSYLTENLASKGYVVVAIDHTDSTHADATAVASTLVNRALDINFVLDYMAEGIFAPIVDADNAALIGYSMGGYGSLIAVGAGVSKTADVNNIVPGNEMEKFQVGNPNYRDFLDPRIKAVVPMAPWGNGTNVKNRTWDPAGLKGISIPSLFIVGNMDRTSGFSGVEFLFKNAVNSDRYMLVYQNGIHAIAVNPTPPIASGYFREYMHYQEPVWDNRRCNNINQHFITAFLGIHLKGQKEYQPYLDVITMANDAETNTPEYWKGFKPWTAVGLELHHLEP